MGTETWARISGMAAADSGSGTDTRTMSAPASCRRWICATVASTSVVGVLVIDCTAIGALPPTVTSPTCMDRAVRRAATI